MFNFTIPTIKIEPNSAGIPVTAIVASIIDVTAISPVHAVSNIDESIALFICLLFLESFSTTGIILSIILFKIIAPNSAGIPVTAIVASIIDVTAISPVHAVSNIDESIDLFICLLFLESFSTTGIILSTILFKIIAPNSAGPPVTADIVKNIDVTNKLPVRTVICFAVSFPFSISLIFISFFDKDDNLSIIDSMLLIPFSENLANSDAENNLNITLFNANTSSLIFFAIF